MKLTQKLTTPVIKTLQQTYALLGVMLLITTTVTSLCILSGFVVQSGLNILLLSAIGFGLIFLARANNVYIGLGSLLGFSVIQGVLLTYSVTIAPVDAVVLALVSTTTIFFGLSAYVTITKRNFSGIGTYLFGALVLLLVVMIANIFIQAAIVPMMISYAAVIIFSGFILYDTSMIISGKEDNPITAALGLYLNVLNIFLPLLNIFSKD